MPIAERESPDDYEALIADWTQPEPDQAAVVREVQARVARIRAKLG